MAPPALFANRPTTALVVRAQRTLGMTHEQFGTALRGSERTSRRWSAGQSLMTTSKLRMLARLVHPRDPALAAEIAETASETLESLGIVAPRPAPTPVLDASIRVELVVSATADVLAVPPSAARAALGTAFGRAKELGLAVDDVVKALRAAPHSATQTESKR